MVGVGDVDCAGFCGVNDTAFADSLPSFAMMAGELECDLAGTNSLMSSNFVRANAANFITVPTGGLLGPVY